MDPQHKEAIDKLSMIEPFEVILQEAEKYAKENKYTEAIDYYTKVISVRIQSHLK